MFNVFHESSPNLSYYCVSLESCLSGALILGASAFPAIFIKQLNSSHTEFSSYFYSVAFPFYCYFSTLFIYKIYVKWRRTFPWCWSSHSARAATGGFSTDWRVICFKTFVNVWGSTCPLMWTHCEFSKAYSISIFPYNTRTDTRNLQTAFPPVDPCLWAEWNWRVSAILEIE